MTGERQTVTVVTAATEVGKSVRVIRAYLRKGLLHNYGSNRYPMIDLAELRMVRWEKART